MLKRAPGLLDALDGAGDIVIMDNLVAHMTAGIRQAIQARGSKPVNLPP